MVPSTPSLGVRIVLDNDTYLMIAIFQNQSSADESELLRPDEFLEEHKDQIRAVGRLFEYLGLAKSKPKSALGWKPTTLLLKLIAERLRNEGAKEEPVGEPFLMTLMMDGAFGATDNDSRFLAERTLRKIGLARVDEDGEIEPTLQLQGLFHEAYCDLIGAVHGEKFFEIVDDE